MRVCVIARSISRPVRERLQQRPEPFGYAQDRRVEGRKPFSARVLAVFEHACDLLTPEGGVVALVTPQVGNGPLNVVVEGSAGLFAGVERGIPATLVEDKIRVGGLEVGLREAAVWEPRPDWASLRAHQSIVTARLPALHALGLNLAPARSLLTLLEASATGDPLHRAVLVAVRQAAEMLRVGWEGDLARLQEGAARLAGLGSGLTPAGDDFLTGAMLWAWLIHSNPRVFCRTLVAAAAPRTTTLSAALLWSAAEGQCSAPWHRLLAELAAGAQHDLARSVREVLAHGATSGADVLAGFCVGSSKVASFFLSRN